MKVVSFTNNPFQENTYVVYDETKECLIIDPGCYTESERTILINFIEENDLKPVRLLNTHCHLDHICGNQFIAKKYALKLEANKEELPMLVHAPKAAEMYGFPMEQSPEIEVFLAEKDVINFGKSSLSILFTPGHSPGSISFYSEKNQFVIAGDVLFKQGIGRTDLPLGDYDTLIKSIQEKLFTLAKKTVVYSGHGPETTIGYELVNNPFF